MAVNGTLIKADANALYDEITNGAALTNTTLSASDYIGIADVDANTGKKITVTNFLKFFKSSYNLSITKLDVAYNASTSRLNLPSNTKAIYMIDEKITGGYANKDYVCTFSNNLIINCIISTQYAYGELCGNVTIKKYNTSGTVIETITETVGTGSTYRKEMFNMSNVAKITITSDAYSAPAVATTLTPTYTEGIPRGYAFS